MYPEPYAYGYVSIFNIPVTLRESKSTIKSLSCFSVNPQLSKLTTEIPAFNSPPEAIKNPPHLLEKTLNRPLFAYPGTQSACAL